MPTNEQRAAAVTSRRVSAARLRIADLAALDPPPSIVQRMAVLYDAARLFGPEAVQALDARPLHEIAAAGKRRRELAEGGTS